MAQLETVRLLNHIGRPHEAAAQLGDVDQQYLEMGDARIRFSYQMMAMEVTFQLHRNAEAAEHFRNGTNLALDAGFTRRLLCHRRQILAVFDWMITTGRVMSARTANFCATALRQAGDGDLEHDLQRRLLPQAGAAGSSAANLSRREAEILGMVSDGLSTKEIASRLSVTASTVKTHRRHIFEKLGVTRRSQAIALARQRLIIY